MRQHVVIVGGGVAGISAAVHALQNGFHPILFEKASTLGGRVRSALARDVDQVIDHGHHILSNGYQETKTLLATLDSLQYVQFQRRLTIFYKWQHLSEIAFRVYPFPSPLHFILPFLMKPFFKPGGRWPFIKSLLHLNSASSETLKKRTVQEMILSDGKPTPLHQILWEPLTLATLNTPVDQASSFLLRQVLQCAFFASASRSGLGFPTRPLQELFGKPAETFLEKHGCSLYLGTRVKALVAEGRRITAIVTHNQQVFETPYLILAVPPHALARIIEQSSLERQWPFVDRFQYSPILTLYLWTKRPLIRRYPLALVDSPFHWIFPLPESAPKQDEFGYALVASASRQMVKMSAEAVAELAFSELTRYLGSETFQKEMVTKTKLIRERRATILQTPESLKWRPPINTPFENVHLAGDWIQTNLPATIESAALSGRLAVESFAFARSQ